jgi:hypothetical protein
MFKISVTAAAAAVQKKGTQNKKSMKLRFIKPLLNMYFLKCLKLIIICSNIF